MSLISILNKLCLIANLGKKIWTVLDQKSIKSICIKYNKFLLLHKYQIYIILDKMNFVTNFNQNKYHQFCTKNLLIPIFKIPKSLSFVGSWTVNWAKFWIYYQSNHFVDQNFESNTKVAISWPKCWIFYQSSYFLTKILNILPK